MSCFSKPLVLLSLLLLSPIALAKGSQGTRLTRNKIEITGEVLFETGSAQIKSGSQALLEQVAKIMKENPDLPKIQIGGHTDDVGEAAGNKKLSAKRAEAVMRHLISLGVDKDRLQAKGFGESRPVAPGKSPKARSKNRRVDFVLIRPLTFSGAIGMTATSVSGSDDLKGTIGFIVASTVHYAITESLSADLGVGYAMRGAKSENDKLSIGYIDVPITAHYTLPLPYFGGFMPHVGGGLKFSFLQGAKFNDEDVEVNSMQTGLIFGMGGTYDIAFGLLSANARYTQSLSALSDNIEGVKLSSFDLLMGLVY